MKAIVLGAGRIGRGFITKLLTLNNVEVTFFDVSEEMVELINSKKEYTIHVLGNEKLNVEVNNASAYTLKNLEILSEKWSEADYIFTAVGGKNLKSIGETLGKAFEIRLENSEQIRTSNVITCENWINPIGDLRGGIESILSKEQMELFYSKTGVSESVVLCTGTGAPDPSQQTNPVDTWVQNLRYLPVNKELILGELPNWKYIEFVEEFGDLLTQKIYTNNTSVATLSYLGYLKGFKLVAESANDPEIEPILDNVYSEINEILIDGMNISKKSQLNFSTAAKAKYTDWAIVDDVTRIGRDPIRKLGPNDRFIGPMKIAEKIGVKPVAIALGAAAALYFDYENDETASELILLRKTKGIDAVLREICEVDPNGQIAGWIKEGIETLKMKGWVKENE